ncbi:MAG TPA: HlyD family efflux transporter periplasmic adaptor subunit [Bryobacteraceae bacterium]|jgi:membrane fusion protein (multidrug efflux system)|nr:HlyD family efflux transporter periplasmic adaptor subunit [Bryobacteraceae bacterium]
MANSFHRVSQSLARDSGTPFTVALLIAVMVVTAWLAWAFGSRITRYEVSDSARIEVDRAAYPIEAGASGRLVSSALVLGAEVHAGDILAELDSNPERLSLQEERIRLAALQPQLGVLQSQLASEDRGRTDERHLLSFSQEGARARYEEAEAQAGIAEQQAARAARLQSEGILAAADAERAKAEAQSKRAAAESLKVAISRLEPELQVREQDRDVRQKQILTDIAKLEADVATSSAAIRRLEYEIDRRRLRAPVSGRLGECAPLHPGSEIAEGQQLGVILPPGEMQMIAEFAPAAALGKIHPGQRATIRLQGFPWAQYGTVSAQVSRVASEIRDGKVRVELALDSAARPAVPLQHGLPGSVEVAVERVSPAALLLRSAGAVMGAR